MLPLSSSVVELINECDRLSIQLLPTDRGIKCLAPPGSMSEELQRAIAAERTNIREFLVQQSDSRRPTSVSCVQAEHPLCDNSQKTSWPPSIAALADFTMLLSENDLPTAPFELSQGRTVIDSRKYLQSLQDDARNGSDGPRAAVLVDELCALRDLIYRRTDMPVESARLVGAV